MGIVLARIDNRLLHGVVATQWAPKTRAQRIMVIDDETASNEMAKASMKLARPAGMAISIISLETAIANLKANKYEGQSIFLIVKRVETIQKLMDETGVRIPELNLGATAQREITSDLIVVDARTTIDPQEAAAYKDLIGRGVSVYAQYLLTDKPRSLAEIVS